jgi:YD repeat-containing protein
VCDCRLKSTTTQGKTTTLTYDAQGRVVQTQTVLDSNQSVLETVAYTYQTGSPSTVTAVSTQGGVSTTTVYTLNSAGVATAINGVPSTTVYDSDGYAIQLTTVTNGVVVFEDYRGVINGDIVTETRTTPNPASFNEIYTTIPNCLTNHLEFLGKASRHLVQLQVQGDGTPLNYNVYDIENGKVVKETVIGSNGAVLQTLTYTYY